MHLSKRTISIVLIEKHTLFRQSIRKILELDAAFNVIAEGETRQDALQLVKKYRPNIILLDINSIKANELIDIKTIKRIAPETKIVILSSQDDDNHMIAALKMGATGYVLKEMNSETFITAIKAVQLGRYWFHPHVTHLLIKEYYYLIRETFSTPINDDQKPIKPLDLFTTREYDVLKLLARGYSNKVIAEKLAITSYTVSSHVRNILKKSRANDRTHAVVKAIENGWVTIERKTESTGSD